MSDNRPIGIFDSGLGGLTVVKEITKLLPNEDIIYFGDTGRVPYGTKGDETIRKYALQDEKFLVLKGVKMIVAACGTVSSVAPDTAKDLKVPFIEVISHSVNAATAATKNKKIGILATPATINSGAHKRKILSVMPDAEVVESAAALLVSLVEEGWVSAEDPTVNEITRRYLEPMINSGVDTVILGCTHFPVLADVVQKIMGDGVKLINMGCETAKAVYEALKTSGSLCDNKEAGNHSFFVSDRPQSFKKTAAVLLDEEIDDKKVTQVDINSL